MTLRSPYVMNSEFDDFLYAAICGETDGPVDAQTDGMPTTVISALARLDIDPWQEAARLADLPKERAATAIGLWIDRLPEGRWKPSDIAAMAARLADLLPRRGAGGTRAGNVVKMPDRRKAGPMTVLWFAAFALGAVMLFTLFADRGEGPAKERAVRSPVSGPILPGN